jgi:hypothetical protein
MKYKLILLALFVGLVGCGSQNQAQAPADPVLENPHGSKPSGPPDLSVLSEGDK